MRFTWPWWVVKPKLGVVLSGGATLGAFEVGVIDVMASRGIVPDFLVGTSVGAINAAFWARTPGRDAGKRLLQLWLETNRSTMFPDGPVPMVGRLFQRSDHLTTQDGLKLALDKAVPESCSVEAAPIPLAVIATDVTNGDRVIIRTGPLRTALLASSAIPGLWPAVELDGRRLVDGGLVSNCDVQAAVEAGMTDVIVVDVMGHLVPVGNMNVGQLVERSLGIAARRQTDLAIKAFGKGVRVALLRAVPSVRTGFGDFSHTEALAHDGRVAADEFLARHLGPRRSVRPGVWEPSVRSEGFAASRRSSELVKPAAT